MYLSISVSALALFSLASAQLANYGGFTAKNPSDAKTVASIHNVLALFNYALDAKDTDAFRDLFTDNVTARVAPTPTNNLDSLIKFYNGTALGNVMTQHTVHTIFVYDLAPMSAKSISYANTCTSARSVRDNPLLVTLIRSMRGMTMFGQNSGTASGRLLTGLSTYM